MSQSGKQAAALQPSCLFLADGASQVTSSRAYKTFTDGRGVWQGQHQSMHLVERSEQHTDVFADLLPERCTSPVTHSPVPMHLPLHISSRLDAPIAGHRHLQQLQRTPTASSISSTNASQQQQIIHEAMSLIPGMHSLHMLHSMHQQDQQSQQQYHSCPASELCSNPGGISSCLQDDDALMDFWVLLQQTQHNLQDMLVDLETAKIELELARGRAEESEHASTALRVQLAAAQQCNTALEGQLQAVQAKESAAAAKAATLTQRNIELATEAHQAQQAAAAMELKLERLQGQLAAMQRKYAAAAAATAAAAAASAPAAAAAQEAAVAAADAIASELKTELSQLKSELAATQSRAARAELELAVARTKVLIAQQEAAAAVDHCKKLERQVTGLTSQLGATAAEAAVAAEDKQKLQAELEALQLRLEAKEARLRGSMNALARASSSLRASYSAQGGAIDPALRASQSSVSQIAAELRNSAQMTAGLLQRAHDLRVSQHLQQQHQQPEQQQPQHTAPPQAATSSYLERIAAELNSTSTNNSSVAEGCNSAIEQQHQGEQQQQFEQEVQPGQERPNHQHHQQQAQHTALKNNAGNTSSNQRPASQFAALASHTTKQQEQQQVNLSQQAHEPHQLDLCPQPQQQQQQPPPAGCDSSTKKLAPQAASGTSTPQCTAAVDWQSPIFRQRKSTAGVGGSSSTTAAQQHRHSRSSSGGGSRVSSGSVSPCCGSLAAAIGKAAALPPRPPRSSSTSSNTTPRSPRGSNPGLSPRLSSGSGCPTHAGCGSGLLSSAASSSTPLFGSPCASRRASSCSDGSTESSTLRLDCFSEDHKLCFSDDNKQISGADGGPSRHGSTGSVGSAGFGTLKLEAGRNGEPVVLGAAVHCGNMTACSGVGCHDRSAPALSKLTAADKLTAVSISSSDKCAVRAGTEAAWAGAAKPSTGSHRDSHTRDDIESAGAAQSAGKSVGGFDVLMGSRPLLRGVSNCSVGESPEGATSRHLSTAGISSLVAATSMGLDPTGAPHADLVAVDGVHGSGSLPSGNSTSSNGSSSSLQRNTTCGQRLHAVLAVLLPLGAAAAGAVLGGLGILQHQRLAARKLLAAEVQHAAASGIASTGDYAVDGVGVYASQQ